MTAEGAPAQKESPENLAVSGPSRPGALSQPFLPTTSPRETAGALAEAVRPVRFGEDTQYTARAYRARPTGILFCGLPGAGKTFAASLLIEKLRARGIRTTNLDSDNMRLFWGTQDDKEGRLARCKENALLAQYLHGRGVFPVCSVVAPYRQARDFFRAVGVEVLVLRTCFVERDPSFFPPAFELPGEDERVSFHKEETAAWIEDICSRFPV